MTGRSSLVESLERRTLLAIATFDGGGSSLMFGKDAQDPLNWVGDVLPQAGDDVFIGDFDVQNLANLRLNSLTLESTNLWLLGTQLEIDSSFQVKTGSSVTSITGKVWGAGKLTIEAGAGWGSASGTPGGMLSIIDLAVDNYGGVGLDPSNPVGPNFHNFGTLNVYGGNVDGVITNEATGVITSGGRPNSGNSTGFGRYQGVAVPFVNHGLVKPGGTNPSDTGLTPDYRAVGWSYGITINIDATPTIGGNWHSSRGNLFFTSASNPPSKVTFDSTFNLIDGTLKLSNVIADVRGLPVDSGLVIVGNASNVTLVQDRATLALLQVDAGQLHLPTGGTHTLRAQDTRIAAGASLDIGDNLFIAGNEPGYRQPTAIMVPPATLTPGFAASINGSLNGTPIAVDGSSRLAVGYSSGLGLGGFHATHTFRGESFEDDDFIFFPTIRGDTNFDLAVNFDDLLLLAKRFRTTTSHGYAQGNFDRPAAENNPIDFDDLLIVSQNYGQTLVIQTPLVAVHPESKRTTRAGRFSDVLV